jgi:hypothetical protein
MLCDYHLRRAREARAKGANCGNPRERLLYEEFARLHEHQARFAVAVELRDLLPSAADCG